MMAIEDNIIKIQVDIQNSCQAVGCDSANVQLLAVTKKASLEQIKTLLELGQKHFAENRLDHLKEMADALKDEKIEWHFIGHLQRNKVKEVLRLCSWVQSVDSLRLIDKLQQEAIQLNKQVNVLIQLNISGEAQKTGFVLDQLEQAAQKVLQSSHLTLRGLMCMAPQFENPEDCRPVFETCTQQFNAIKQLFNLDGTFDALSMGMSHDFPVAIECGATQVRIGTLLYK